MIDSVFDLRQKFARAICFVFAILTSAKKKLVARAKFIKVCCFIRLNHHIAVTAKIKS